VGAGRGSKQTQPVASLTNTYWKPVKLGDQAVTLGAGKKELHMVLVSEENRVRGYSGCNQFMGGFDQDGEQLKFTQIVSTMKACMEGMQQEKKVSRCTQQNKPLRDYWRYAFTV
jgi:heat shock protein HslJ